MAAGSPCRSHSGAGTYHTGRFTKVGRLEKLLRVQTPAERGPGQLCRPGTPPPAPTHHGCAHRRHPDRLRRLQLADPRAAVATRCPRGARHRSRQDLRREDLDPGRVRPQFGAALTLARQIKAHAPHCRVIATVHEMKRLGRDAAELTALADHLVAHSLVLEMLTWPLAGLYNPSGPGRMLFGFFAAMAETEREAILGWSRNTAETGRDE
ncbi:recombinase family protein [Nonomuraea endophytica]|uniref:recombinase family protein n=1 Tax=Nonomuraea endophytica TaxID=714136 RepID=UPI0037CCBC4A